ncbi:hypothetical protein [Alkalihalobacillus sp. LMS39]|uniref:hypothetical protein n=1 Tax=Alkalihalobacillus sp. LMS39 TaxID=2924032 RepID=UPI001FB3C983|nr:hypothetical protein [Alkalihalobacillus sp. LMS39]UOE95718.1 hypothetical protein MM271_08995 [Alkalihalobacillus sp. LMS39]
MELVIIILFILSILFFILSFVQKDRTKDLENQIENFSITLMQEIYQLKKKIKIVEEELLSSNSEPYYDQQQKQTTGSLMNEVAQHYENGYSIERISQLTGLTETEVQSLLANYLRKE